MRGFNRFKNKYNAKPTGGFPSKLEAALYDQLLLREKLGEIRNIKRQVTVILQDGPREEKISWRVDFSFEEAPLWRVVFAEAKGLPTNEYKLKLKLWRRLKPAPLEIWMGNYRNIKRVERIEGGSGDE